METRLELTLTEAQLRRVLTTGYDVDMRNLRIYDLRAQASYVLLNAGNQPLDGGITSLDQAQMIVSNIDDKVTGQISADAVRIMLSRVTGTVGAAAVRITITTALQPDFETAKLDEEFTKEALEAEFLKRDLADRAVSETQSLEPGSVGSQQIKDRAITTPKLMAASVTSSKIGKDAVKSFHIQDRAVSGRKLSVGAISGSKLEKDAVSGDKIRDASITLDKLAPDARAATGVSPTVPSGAITTDKIAIGSVGTNQIANGAVSSNKLKDGSLDSRTIATGAVSGDKIAPQSITLEHFADSPASEIPANSVDGSKLQNGAINADKLAVGLLPAGDIAGDAELSALDLVVVAGTVLPRMPVALFTNSAGDLQASSLAASAIRTVYPALPAGVSVDSLLAGIVRAVNGDGTAVVAVTRGAMVSGFTNLVAGSYYKVSEGNFIRTTVGAEAQALAVSADTMRLI